MSDSLSSPAGLWAGIAAFAYLAATFKTWLALRTGSLSAQELKRLVLTGSMLAVTLHTLALYYALFQPTGLVLGWGNAVSLFAWQAAFIFSILVFAYPLEVLGLLVLPFGALSALIGLWMQGNSTPIRLDWTIQLHALLSIIAYGLITLAAAQALLLSIQTNRLQHNKAGGFLSALPPIQTMETALFRMLVSGYALLCLAVLSGVLFVDNLFAQHLAHKTVLSFIALAVFGVLLWGRWRHGWRGKRALRLILGGYCSLVLAYFGSKFVLELILQRHWT